MDSFYYTLQRVLSFNALINFIIGERGVGKSFSSKKHVINRFIKKGEEFVYLRRYKTELKSSVPKFFDDIIDKKVFPEASFKVKNNNFYINDKIAGYALPLSTANILKSTSLIVCESGESEIFDGDENLKKSFETYKYSKYSKTFVTILRPLVEAD